MYIHILVLLLAGFAAGTLLTTYRALAADGTCPRAEFIVGAVLAASFGLLIGDFINDIWPL